MKEQHLLELHVNNADAMDAVAPIRWCLSQKALQTLREQAVRNPYLLLVISKPKQVPDFDYMAQSKTEYWEVERRLIPLDRMMEYVEFHAPGVHRVSAAIVWDFYDNIADLRENYSWQARPNLIGDGSGLQVGFCSLGEAVLDIQVPETFFAAEPPAWEKHWVNLWFESDPKNQCQYRRRRMLAYTVQPLTIALWFPITIAARILAAFALLLCGMRKIGYSAIFHPWNEDLDDVWLYRSASVFIEDSNGNQRSQIWVAFMPFWFVVLLGIAQLYAFINNVPNVWTIVWSLSAIWITLAVLAYAIVRLFKSKSSTQEIISQRRKQREEDRLQKLQAQYEAMQALTCGGNTAADLRALPSEYRTVRLRFMDLKAKVCRPFAR